MIRAKFRCDAITRQSYSRLRGGPEGERLEKLEKHTVRLSPVYSSDPNSENRQFWDANPSGGIELGTVKADAAAMFELDGEYYVDFRPARARELAPA